MIGGGLRIGRYLDYRGGADLAYWPTSSWLLCGGVAGFIRHFLGR